MNQDSQDDINIQDAGPPEELEMIDEEHLGEKEKKLNKLKREIESCRMEKDEYLSGWRRAKADYINYKKDEEKRIEDFARFSGLGIFRELLNVADSLEKAAITSDDQGIKNICAQMSGVFGKFGVGKIEAVGRVFDPAAHESVAEAEVSDHESDNKVIEELQAGYMMHDRVLRPARVKVGVFKKVEDN